MTGYGKCTKCGYKFKRWTEKCPKCKTLTGIKNDGKEVIRLKMAENLAGFVFAGIFLSLILGLILLILIFTPSTYAFPIFLGMGLLILIIRKKFKVLFTSKLFK